MKKRYLIFTILLLLTTNLLYAQEGKYYIYGKCILVSKDTLTGFISFKEDRLWVSQFKASKVSNPYSKFFSNNKDILFGEHLNTTPNTHSFVCRYNSIKKIRPIAANRLKVTIKDDRSIDLTYNFSSNPIVCHLGNTSTEVDWSDISHLEFESSPKYAPYDDIYVGEVKSTQGIYYGIIERYNYKSKIPRDIEFTDEAYINFNLDSVDSLKRSGNSDDVTIISGKYTGEYKKQGSLRGVEVNLPSTGTIYIPWEQLHEINRKPANKLLGATYNDSPPIKRLVANIVLQDKRELSGSIAYDLDEVLNIEFIEGKNDNIIYSILFDKVAMVEQRNHMHSLVTIKNGGRLSLGDSQDVTSHNNGVILLESNTYIPWSNIFSIEFK